MFAVDAQDETIYWKFKVTDHRFRYSYETNNHMQAAAEGNEHGNINGNFYRISPERGMFLRKASSNTTEFKSNGKNNRN